MLKRSNLELPASDIPMVNYRLFALGIWDQLPITPNNTFAVVEVCVPYNTNLAQVYQVIEEVGQQLKANYLDVLEPTQVDGV